ncbi:thioesterase family protein [Undibacterium sp. Ji83W]|uniref:thioesterase family protein n=1 Tax=Undibacterium sp. Ji83W TaxID=3413043 RepID=UPI003BF149CA
MSGLIRNFLTVVQALLAYCLVRKRVTTGDRVSSHFWITPWDTGIKALKSDKYFQLAESAQLDFVIKTGMLRPMLGSGTAFVNVSQLVSFMKPVHIFQRVRVDTRILYADDKCAYFSHEIYAHDALHAEVLVKMKFKRGRLTVNPFELLNLRFEEQAAHLRAWDQALQAMALTPVRQTQQ